MCIATVKMRFKCCVFFGVCFFASQLCLAQELTPSLGEEIPAKEIARLPKQIFANGAGLPTGSGVAADGLLIYESQCQSCHGQQGRGGSALELIGDRSLLATEYPDKGINVYWPYAPPLFAYIQRAMPPDKPYSLDNDSTYAVIAYLLYLGALIDASETVDATTLAELQLPNRDGFNSLVPHDQLLPIQK